jgi:hypothetical protein
MADTPTCALVGDTDGAYRLTSTTPPNPGATIARIKPIRDQHHTVTHWRLVPIVTLHGPTSRKWTSAAEAIAATRLMTVAQARRAVNDADTAAEANTP